MSIDPNAHGNHVQETDGRRLTAPQQPWYPFIACQQFPAPLSFPALIFHHEDTKTQRTDFVRVRDSGPRVVIGSRASIGFLLPFVSLCLCG